MASSLPPSYLESVNVESSTTTSIHLSWQVSNDITAYVRGFRVHYQKEASKYVQYGPMLAPSASAYDVTNLVADTFYKVCLVLYRNDTSPMRQCVGASTTNWRLPVSISIGSSIGAVLALSMIVIMVLAVARCPFMVKFQKDKKYVSRKYDSMSSHFTYDFSDTVTHDPEDYGSEDMGLPYDLTNHSHRQEYDCSCNSTSTSTRKKSSLRHKCVGGVRPKIPRRQRTYLSHTQGVFSSTDSQQAAPSVHSNFNGTRENMNANCNTDTQCPQCMYSNEQHPGIETTPQCTCSNCTTMNLMAQAQTECEQCRQCQHDGSIELHADPNIAYTETRHVTQTNTSNPSEMAVNKGATRADNSARFKSWHDQRSSSISQSETESSELLPKSSNSYEMKEIKAKTSNNNQTSGVPVVSPLVLLETCIDDV